nr:MAG TPA: hypothetical protein [Caudoviricetes sp.]
MVSGEALKKLQEQIAAWPMTQRFVVQQLIRDYLRDREDVRAYEATRLTPEEVSTLVKDWSDLCTIVGECGGITRVKALAEADKDGRLVVLPCKVGDVVFGIHNGQTVLPMVAKWIETNTDGWTVAAQYSPMAPKFYRFSDFGKTVFRTLEEAEKALRRADNG